MTQANPLEYLYRIITVRVDRPMGTAHPQHGFLYPVNYGFIPGTLAEDGEELDAYILGVFEPLDQFTGCCIAVIHRLNDADDKLVIVPEGIQYSDDQTKALTEFQERFFSSEILRE